MGILEEWRDIIGFEGYYQVSNLGRVKSLPRIIVRSNGVLERKKGKLLSICYNKRVNIYQVYLSKNQIKKACAVHRFVAEAFIYNDDVENKTTVNHKDGDRSNNKVDNLEWSSYSENLQHAYNILDRPVNKSKNKGRKCKSINKNTKEEITYDSIAEASRKTNISETQIRRIIGKECVNKKYEFEYI